MSLEIGGGGRFGRSHTTINLLSLPFVKWKLCSSHTGQLEKFTENKIKIHPRYSRSKKEVKHKTRMEECIETQGRLHNLGSPVQMKLQSLG